MILKVLLTICIFVVKSNCTYILFDEKVSWEEAEAKCETIGMRLVVMETKSDVDRLRNFLGNKKPDMWVGLKWNSTLGKYVWLTGDPLPVADWCSAPDYKSSNQACVIWDNECMLSVTCSSTKKYICFNTDNANGYLVINDNVDYFTAKQACENNGGHLPMIRTMKEKQEFIDFVDLHVNEKIWLGGEEVSEDNIKWLSGEEFPIHLWFHSKFLKDIKDYDYIHMHINSNSFEFHSESGRTAEYVCETVEEPKDTRYFTHVADNMTTLALPLAELHVAKKIQCAVECSKALRCRKYTLKLSMCTLYKDVLFKSSLPREGTPLWIKKDNK